MLVTDCSRLEIRISTLSVLRFFCYTPSFSVGADLGCFFDLGRESGLGYVYKGRRKAEFGSKRRSLVCLWLAVKNIGIMV
jgi:hypothetical protein